MTNKIVAWWSGGVTSAVTCSQCISLFGKENVRLIFIDTRNEDEDIYRFKRDCEQWYGMEIEVISNSEYSSIQEVWRTFLSLNMAHGAVCSIQLKRRVREMWQLENGYKHQAFGFDITESRRALSMSMNHSVVKPIYPLMLYGMRKKRCIQQLESIGIEIPRMYRLGFHNNNCFKTGCVKGGIGYWKKMQEEFPEKFEAMAQMEHELTDLKGQPVTMLKDQSRYAQESGNKLVFLKPHPSYPQLKDISMMHGYPVMPLVECNGFCGVDDLSPKSKTHNEINYSE